MPYKKSISIAASLLSFTGAAHSEDRNNTFTTEVAVSNMLIDRGEQLSAEALEFAVTLEQSVDAYTVYLSGYLINPIGDDADAFEQEIDYTVGAAWSGSGYTVDVSANWLTYPDTTSDNSVEIATEFALNAPLSPALLAFYDTKSEDWGIALEAGPRYSFDTWELYTIGRVGVVEFNDATPSRFYAGAEAGVSMSVRDNTSVELYARYEQADSHTFVKQTSNGIPASYARSGVAFGLRLNTSL